MAKINVQEIILTLQNYWSNQGCLLLQAYCRYWKRGRDNESHTFLRAIGPEPWNTTYVEPSRRPADGRYMGKPKPFIPTPPIHTGDETISENIQELYLGSLELLELTH